MFEQSLLSKNKTRRPWTFALAVAIEALVVGVLILVPLMYVQAIPTPDLVTRLTLPAPPPAPPPPPPPAAARKIVKVTPRKFNPQGLTAPREIPKQVAQVNEPAVPAMPDVPSIGGVVGGIPGGVPGGIAGGVVGSIPNVAPPPPPPAPKPAEPATPARIQVGGQVEAAKILNEVQPKYPRIAAEARITGVVRLKAVISKDGHIQDLALISGHPMLVQAAMNAVRQWTYQPTELNGKKVEIDTEIDVTFTLS
jgi:periplasmic protein TonB